MSPDTCLQEKNNVIRLFKQDCVKEASLKLTTLLDTYPEDYELHYLAGMIHGSQLRYADALKSFRAALRLNPKHGSSHFESGHIQMTLCRYNAAINHFKITKRLGCNLTETNYYLSKIKKLVKPKDVTLSACLIVKNEGKFLPACLKSLQGICDEIVVVDTGSEDHTVAIAEKFGAKIFHYEWQQDFAAARNFANQQATGDWILQLDADEELFPEDQFKVREFIHRDDCNGAYLALHNRVSGSFGEQEPTIHYLVRLYKNHKNIYFENPIHEVLKISGEVISVDINILHHGYNFNTGELELKRRRNSEILYSRLKEDPDNTTTLFYLSMLHLANKEFDLAESFGEQALGRIAAGDIKKQHIYLMLLNNLALVALEKGKFDDVKKYAGKAIATNENYLDPAYFLGLAHFREGDFAGAKKVYQNYLATYQKIERNPVFNLFSNSSNAYLFQVYHTLGKIYRKEKNYPFAEEMLTKAIESNPTFWIGFLDLAYLCIDRKEWKMAANYLGKGIQLARENKSVTKENKAVWFDFTNGVKNYMKVLKKIRAMDEEREA